MNIAIIGLPTGFKVRIAVPQGLGAGQKGIRFRATVRDLEIGIKYFRRQNLGMGRADDADR